jgi:hypothetical protein
MVGPSPRYLHTPLPAGNEPRISGPLFPSEWAARSHTNSDVVDDRVTTSLSRNYDAKHMVAHPVAGIA